MSVASAPVSPVSTKESSIALRYSKGIPLKANQYSSNPVKS